jgi:putative endonuclease
MTETRTDDVRGGPNRAPDNRALRNRALGDYGERVAARHLTDQGMVVLDRNWRCEEGELDLVLRDGPALVGWMRDHGVHPAETRVDLVAVLRPRRGRALVEHVRGIG